MKSLKTIRPVVHKVLKELGFVAPNIINTVEQRGFYLVQAWAHELSILGDVKSTEIQVYIRNVDDANGNMVPAVSLCYTRKLDYVRSGGTRGINQKVLFSRDFYRLKQKELVEDIRAWLREQRLDLYYGRGE